jgi:hypothetical protein
MRLPGRLPVRHLHLSPRGDPCRFDDGSDWWVTRSGGFCRQGRMVMDQLLVRWSIAADRAIEVPPVEPAARQLARGGGTRRPG